MGSCASIEADVQYTSFHHKNKVAPTTTLLSVLSFHQHSGNLPFSEKKVPTASLPVTSKKATASKKDEEPLRQSFHSEFGHQEEMVNLIEELVHSFIDIIPKTETVLRHHEMIHRLIKQLNSQTLNEDQTTIFLHYLKQEFQALLVMTNRICSPRSRKLLLSPRQQCQLQTIMMNQDGDDSSSQIGFETIKWNDFTQDIVENNSEQQLSHGEKRVFLPTFLPKSDPVDEATIKSKDEEFRSFIQNSLPRIQTMDLNSHVSDKTPWRNF